MKKLASTSAPAVKPCLAPPVRVPHLSRDGILPSKQSTVKTGKRTGSHWNKTLPFTPSGITFSYSASNSEKTSQKPGSYPLGSCWSWVPPLKDSTETQHCGAGTAGAHFPNSKKAKGHKTHFVHPGKPRWECPKVCCYSGATAAHVFKPKQLTFEEWPGSVTLCHSH